ncbi:OLC1v1016009C1 [Oldenlandia corymbosa var. corymbosa]|uniref:OLC1v1016009C1 n=1 Tax=Oldenlandia corymbosa var. corymbosa TaxID=529605 RepID=A0AAV1E6J4_OLDCO|nr:OLC1v1016009C1 [Oldenlandia corymbosa var. corymbosa]
MANVGLSDTIPDWFEATFSNVQRWNLSGNNICGVMPSSMKNLKSLITVDLSKNQLTGSGTLLE